jgi:hypothetical protein
MHDDEVFVCLCCSTGLLLVSYTGTDVPDATGSSSSKLDSTPAAAESAAAEAPVAADADAAAPAAAAAAAAETPGRAIVTLELLRSRFTFIPEPRLGLAGPDGPLYAKKPVVATADSSVAGVAGALESKLNKLGAAWLYSDGTVAGNKAAWEAFATVGRKFAGKAGKSSLLALVKIEADTSPTAAAVAKGAKSGKGAEVSADQQQQQDGSGQQQEQQKESGSKQQKGSGPAGYRLSLLVVNDEDVPRSVMQVSNG